VIVVLFLSLGFLLGSREVHADVAPALPTLELAWGSFGSYNAEFSGPQGVATDRLGNVYVADAGNHVIKKFDTLGNWIGTVSSNGTAPGQTTSPIGVAIDAAGNVFVADPFTDRVTKFSSDGTYLLSWSVPADVMSIAVNRLGTLVYISGTDGWLRSYSGTGVTIASYGAVPIPLRGLAVGPDGSVYGSSSNAVFKYRANCTLDVQLLSEGSAPGKVASPQGLAFDALGNLYVCDVGNSRIQKHTASGAYLCDWPGGFTPWGISVDPAGNVYVSDKLDAHVTKFRGAGSVPPFPPPFAWAGWGSTGTDTAQFRSPGGIAIRNNLVYVVDCDNDRVEWFGIVSGSVLGGIPWGGTGITAGKFRHPWGVAIDAVGQVYVTDALNQRVQKFTSNGTYITQWGSFGTGGGQFNSPAGIALSPSGEIYVVDSGNCRIQRFAVGTAFSNAWGSAGNGPGQFLQPKGIAIDAAECIYVVDQGNARIQKFSPFGDHFLLSWGSAGTGPGQFQSPSGISVDDDGNIAVVDSGNHRIQLFTSSGKFLAQAGSLGTDLAHLSQPSGVAADAYGNLFITDTGNDRVVEYASPPRILMTADVGNDQGEKVRVTLTRASIDSPTFFGGLIGSYRVDFRNDSLSAWSPGTNAPATGDATYELIAPTAVNANAGSNYFTNFRVTALGTEALSGEITGGTTWGYSIDNLSPPPPTALSAIPLGAEVRLTWSASPAADLAAYRLHRGTSADFVPAPDNLVVETAATEYVDANPAAYYKLMAVDRNGNVSPAVTATSGVEVPRTAVFALRGPLENPARAGHLDVQFSLAHSGPAEIELIDVAGRRVLGRDVGAMGTGSHTVTLGTGEHIAAGVYHLRLRQGAEFRIARVAVLR